MGRFCKFTCRLLAVVAVGGAACMVPWIDRVAASDVPVLPTSPASEAMSSATFDVWFNTALTSNYISRGITNSDSRPAIQGYVKPYTSWGYLSVWTSNVDFGAGFSGEEIDAAVGLTPKFNSLSFDLGYVHYFYTPEDVSPDYGELYGTVSYEFSNKLKTIGKIYFAPDYIQSGKTGTYIESGLDVLCRRSSSCREPWDISFSRTLQPSSNWLGTSDFSYTWKALTLEARYWDTDLSDDECVVRSGFSNGCDARIVGTVSVDTTWRTLKNLGR